MIDFFPPIDLRVYFLKTKTRVAFLDRSSIVEIIQSSTLFSSLLVYSPPTFSNCSILFILSWCVNVYIVLTCCRSWFQELPNGDNHIEDLIGVDAVMNPNSFTLFNQERPFRVSRNATCQFGGHNFHVIHLFKCLCVSPSFLPPVCLFVCLFACVDYFKRCRHNCHSRSFPNRYNK